MREEGETPETTGTTHGAVPTRRSRRQAPPPPIPAPEALPTQWPTSRKPRRRSTRSACSARSILTLAAVGALVAVVAIAPVGMTDAADGAAAGAATLQQLALDDAQSLVVASDMPADGLSRDSYSATSQAEIDEVKAREAAAAAARARAQAEVASVPFDYSTVPAATGAVRWPVGGPFRVTDRFGARGGAHMGTDMVAEGGTPVYASLDGVVRISQESYGGYGVAIVLESVFSGQQVSTTYPHMQSGSRQVSIGDTVSAGQLLGYVGSTGRSTANHLHFEVYLSGTAVDSLVWLQQNAG